jgi:hypothetical protein
LRIWTVALFILLAATSSACNGPCRELAELVCSCEPNANEEQACIVNIDAESRSIVTEQDTSVCTTLLDSCTCEALDRGDYAACGLTRARAQ